MLFMQPGNETDIPHGMKLHYNTNVFLPHFYFHRMA